MADPSPIFQPLLHRVWDVTFQDMRAIVQYRQNSIVMDVKMPDGMAFSEQAIQPLVASARSWGHEHLDEEIAFSRALSRIIPETHPRQAVLKSPDVLPISGWDRVEVDVRGDGPPARSPDLRLIPIGIDLWLLHYPIDGAQSAPRPPDLREFYLFDVQRRGVTGYDAQHSMARLKMPLAHFVTLMQTIEDDVMRGVAPRPSTDEEIEIIGRCVETSTRQEMADPKVENLMLQLDMLDFRQTPFPDVAGLRFERSGVGVAGQGRVPLVVAPRVIEPFTDNEDVPPHWDKTRLYLVDKDTFVFDLSPALQHTDQIMLAGALSHAAPQWCAELDRFDTQLAVLAPGHPRLERTACPPIPAVGLGMRRLSGKPESPSSAQMPLTIAYAGDGVFLIDTRTTELEDLDVPPNTIVGIQLVAPDQANLLGGPEEPTSRFLGLMVLFASALMAVAWPQQRLVLDGQDPSTLPWATNQNPAAQALLAQRSSLTPTVRPLPLRAFSPAGDPVRSRPPSPEPAPTAPASDRPDVPALMVFMPDGTTRLEPYTGPPGQFRFGAKIDDPSSPTGTSLMVHMSRPKLPTGKITVGSRAINLQEVLPTGPPRAKPATAPTTAPVGGQSTSRPRPEDIGAEKAGCGCVAM